MYVKNRRYVCVSYVRDLKKKFRFSAPKERKKVLVPKKMSLVKHYRTQAVRTLYIYIDPFHHYSLTLLYIYCQNRMMKRIQELLKLFTRSIPHGTRGLLLHNNDNEHTHPHDRKHNKEIYLDLNAGKDGRKDGESTMLFERRVGDKDLHLVLSALRTKDVKDVKEIDLRSNRIGDDGARMLSEFLEWSCRVEVLRLNSNDIGEKGAIRLAKTLGTNTSLKVLNLNDNKIGKKGSLAIAKAFQTNSTLEILDLGNTDLDTGAVIELSENLRTCASLKELNLSSPTRVRKHSDVIFQHIGKMLAINNTLERLTLRKSGMGDDEAEILVSYLAENNTLRSLDLSRNSIGHVGASALARLLVAQSEKSHQNGCIENLDLSANRIQDKGALAFSVAIERDVGLKTLRLNSNSITDNGLFSLAKSISANSKLRSLHVWGNDFQSRSAKQFHDSFASFSSSLSISTDIKPYCVDGVWRAAKDI